ncbi:MAG: 30S ribosomal protein S18 [Fibromonadaceae bacterium]|jgi:small subunit ribosomal protein S18|nr:30S ribosomal protein S18 [Fibromonadaceae bacterium]
MSFEEKKNERNNRVPRKKNCWFCENKISFIDYKDEALLRRFLSDRGKILPRRLSGTCAKHQRKLIEAIKRARHVALLSFVADSLR